MESAFQFKQFSVRQNRCAMKVGTDGILLGAWCSPCDNRTAARILDIGTGTGLIALMLAQRNPNALIDAIEVDHAACEQATENFAASRWSERLRAISGCVKDLCTDLKYDLIVSNPPWFRDSLKSPSDARNTARHDDTLNATELLVAVDRLLTADGRFSTVLPGVSCLEFRANATRFRLHCVRNCQVQPKVDKLPARCLLEFSRTPPICEVVPETLIVETGTRHDYTTDFRNLTRDFYLRF